MEKKRGVERKDSEKELFKDIYLKRCEYLLKRRLLKEQEIYNLVRDFFKELLDIEYEFTEQELIEELKSVYMEESTQKRLHRLIKDVFRIQYEEKSLSDEELKKVIGEFQKSIDILVTERPKKSILHKILHSFLRKREPRLAELQKEARTEDRKKDVPVLDSGLKKAIGDRFQEEKKEEDVPDEKPQEKMVVKVPPVKIDWTSGEEQQEKNTSSVWVQTPQVNNGKKKEDKTNSKKAIKNGKSKEHTKEIKKKNNKKTIKRVQKAMQKDKKEKDDAILKIPKGPLTTKTKKMKKKRAVQKDETPPKTAPLKSAVVETAREEIPYQEEEKVSPLDPHARMESLFGEIDSCIAKDDMLNAKKAYNEMHLIYKNLPEETKPKFFQRMHESYRRIKGITPAS
ncbi:MAG: hypothetical protein ABIJ21_01110 [Nanoarchaeota archaeon]